MALSDYLERLRKPVPVEDTGDVNGVGASGAMEPAEPPVSDVNGAVPPASPDVPATVPAEPPVPRPDGMSEEYWDEIRRHMSPGDASRFYSKFNASSATPFYQAVYKANMRAPEAPDEKSAKARDVMAGVGDALSLLVQGIGASKGAYVRPSDRTAIGENAERERRLRDIYKADRERYDAGLYQSVLADMNAARDEHARGRNNLLGIMRGYDSDKRSDERYEEGIKRQEKLDERSEYWRQKGFDRQAERDRKEDAYRSRIMSGGGRSSSSSSSSNGDMLRLVSPSGETFDVNRRTYEEAIPVITGILMGDPAFKERYDRAASRGKARPGDLEAMIKSEMFRNGDALEYLGMLSGKGRRVVDKGDDKGAWASSSPIVAPFIAPYGVETGTGTAEPGNDTTGQSSGDTTEETEIIDYKPKRVSGDNGSDSQQGDGAGSPDEAMTSTDRPSDKYEAIVREARKEEEKPDWLTVARLNNDKKREEIKKRIALLSEQIVPEIDEERFIAENRLVSKQALKVRHEAIQDRRRNKEILDEIERLQSRVDREESERAKSIRSEEATTEKRMREISEEDGWIPLTD